MSGSRSPTMFAWPGTTLALIPAWKIVGAVEVRTIGASELDWLRARLEAAEDSERGRLSRRQGTGTLSQQLGREPATSLPQIGR